MFTLRIAGIDVKVNSLPKHESRALAALKAYKALPTRAARFDPIEGETVGQWLNRTNQTLKEF